MNFELSHEQQAIVDTFARFSDARIAPQAAALDETREFPHALFGELAGLGGFGMRYPEEVGGTGTGLFEFCLALAEVARGSMSLAGAMAMQSLMGTKFLHMLGTPDIVDRLLRPAIAGRRVGAICMTEPDAGSDLGSIATSATRVDGGYRLRGTKTWVTNAPLADFFTVFARSGSDKKLTVFLVEKGFPGLVVGRAIHKLGVVSLPTSEVHFDDCFVPDTHRLSREEGDGEAHLRKTLAEVRIVTGAMALGVARASLQEALRYAGERRQFGQPIQRYQAIQMKLAEMAVDLDAATLMVHHAAWLYDSGRPHHKEAAACKLFATEAAASISVKRTSRRYRWTGGGTSEILKLVISKALTG